MQGKKFASFLSKLEQRAGLPRFYWTITNTFVSHLVPGVEFPATKRTSEKRRQDARSATEVQWKYNERKCSEVQWKGIWQSIEFP